MASPSQALLYLRRYQAKSEVSLRLLNSFYFYASVTFYKKINSCLKSMQQ